MFKPHRPPHYAWQRHPIFQFFGSVSLAILLLSVLIVASIAGTLYESSFDAKVARHYIYQAPWFSAWLLFLALNLAGAALSRMPWKKHHTGFLITHLGIIILLAGSWIGRATGIEGTMTLFKGDAPNNMLLVDEHVLQVSDGKHVSQAIPAEIIGRKPTPEKPRLLTTTPDGWQVALTGHAPALHIDMTPKPLTEGGLPAIHVTVATAMMGQKLDAWMLADHPSSSTFDMGLASIRFKRGRAAEAPSSPAPTPAATPNAAPAGQAVEIEETIFAFANTPEQISKAMKGGPTGAKIKLIGVGQNSSGSVQVEYQGQTAAFPVADTLKNPKLVAGTPFTLVVREYWPDFRIRDGIPGTASKDPNNPAVLVTLTGTAVPLPETPAHAGPGAAPPMDANAGAANSLTIFLDDAGTYTYELSSRKMGKTSGTLVSNEPLSTGWADWQLVLDQALPHAEEHFVATPEAEGTHTGGAHSEGVRVRATRGDKSAEQWVPLGWQISLPTEPPLRLAYGFRQIPLPIGIRLLEFEVERNEGTDTPGGFKSTVEITNIDGQRKTGQCWMNNPISFPGSWINTWSGFTFKIAQASWNPENLNQSTLQILRDPGWGLKWIGSLLVVCGVFTMFYLRPYPQDLLAAPKQPSLAEAAPQPKQPLEV